MKKTKKSNIPQTLKFKGHGLKKGDKVVHYHPHAYCVAKPALLCSVFLIPPQNNRFIDEDYESAITVHWESAKEAEIGRWYSVAYINRGTSGITVCLPHQPKACKDV